jgi:hypothetical protein
MYVTRGKNYDQIPRQEVLNDLTKMIETDVEDDRRLASHSSINAVKKSQHTSARKRKRRRRRRPRPTRRRRRKPRRTS